MTDKTLANRNGNIDRRKFLSWAGSLAAGTGLLGTSMLPIAAASEPFRVGWVRPTTGRLASSYAPLYVTGLMAIDEINATGGIMGRLIEKVEVDDEGAPAKQPGVFKRLQSEKVQYVLGPTGDAHCMASLPTSTAARMVQACFTHGTKAMDGTQYPYSYVLFHSVQNIADVAVAHFHGKGARRFGILVENSSAGEAATAASKATLSRYGLEPTTVQVFPHTASTVVPYLTNLRKADTEVILSFLGNAPVAALVLNATAEMQWFPQLTGHGGTLYESLFNVVPIEAMQNVTAVTYRGLTWTPAEPPSQRAVAFAKKLLTYPDVNAPHNVATSPFYDFLYLLKHVVEQEKTFDVATVKAAIDKVKGFDGLRGKISFTPEHHGGVSADALVLATAVSSKDPRSMNSVFRQRVA